MKQFFAANPFRYTMDMHTRVLADMGLLSLAVCAADRYADGIPHDKQHLVRSHQIIKKALGRLQTPLQKEWLRWKLVPMFERSAIQLYDQGLHALAGLGYVNEVLIFAKKTGGQAIIEARNSHPSNFWSINAEEHARWDCKIPPIDTAHHMRQQRSAAIADYLISPSNFVTDSFVSRGFSTEKVIQVPYPVDLEVFKPAILARPKNRPFTMVSTGLITLRKGYQYLFEAFTILKKEIPDIRLILIRNIADNMFQVMKDRGYDKLPMEWRSPMGHHQLAELMRDSDVYVLPTLEEGMVRTVGEALACGLPVITTPNAGANDWIIEGANGSIVPIRDIESLVRAILQWRDIVLNEGYKQYRHSFIEENLSFAAFSTKFTSELKRVGLISHK